MRPIHGTLDSLPRSTSRRLSVTLVVRFKTQIQNSVKPFKLFFAIFGTFLIGCSRTDIPKTDEAHLIGSWQPAQKRAGSLLMCFSNDHSAMVTITTSQMQSATQRLAWVISGDRLTLTDKSNGKSEHVRVTHLDEARLVFEPPGGPAKEFTRATGKDQ